MKDHLVQTAQKNFMHGQDIAISLRDLQVKDLSKLKPVRLDSTASDDASRKQEHQGIDIGYQAELERYLDRKDQLEQNLFKAYALIFSTCLLYTSDAADE